jgi:hypothetical protein
MRRSDKLTDEVRRHISAARAFHTGLAADTHQVTAGLHKLAEHLDVLRHPVPGFEEKLKAVEASCRHLNALDKLHNAWHETYHDLKRSLRRVRFHLRRLAPSKRRKTVRS